MAYDAKLSRRNITALICVLAVTALFIVSRGGINVGYANHAGLLPIVRRILDPQYLPNDFGITLRLYHHRFFAYLIAALSLIFGEDRALIILAVTGMFSLSAALFYLCRVMGLSPLGFLAVASLLAGAAFWTGRGLETNDFIGNAEINPTTFAHACVLLGVAMLLHRRIALVALLAGLALLFHLQIGLIFLALLMPFALPLLKNYDRGKVIRAGLLLLIPASLSLLYLFLMLQRGVASAEVLSYNAYRQPHHFELLSTAAALWVTAHLLVQAVVWWLLRYRARSSSTGVSRATGTLLVMSATLGLLALVHFLDFYVLKIGPISMIQMIRMSPLITVFGAMTLVVGLNYWARQDEQKTNRSSLARTGAVTAINLGLIILSVYWAVSWQTIPPLNKFAWVKKYAEQPTTWADICRWIKLNAPPDALFLTPPGREGFTYLTSRSTVVEYKINPDGGQRLPEWLARLRDVCGGTLPQGKGFGVTKQLDAAFASLSDDELRALAQKYQAAYALLPISSKANFPVLYQNKDFKLESIPVSDMK